MVTKIDSKTKNKSSNGRNDLARKAALFDELVEFIEQKYLGFLMEGTEKEKSLTLSQAKRALS
ncbi:MAG TPA: hypothetical protein VJJ24_03445 [Candidatus Paceibacterota bacterium]